MISYHLYIFGKKLSRNKKIIEYNHVYGLAKDFNDVFWVNLKIFC